MRLHPEETEQEEKHDRKSSKRTKREGGPGASDILYLKSIHFDSFHHFQGITVPNVVFAAGLTRQPTDRVFLRRAEEKCNRMTSLAEARGFKLLASAAPDLVSLNKQKFTRIYPKGTRFASTNYDPVPFWNAGYSTPCVNVCRDSIFTSFSFFPLF